MRTFFQICSGHSQAFSENFAAESEDPGDKVKAYAVNVLQYDLLLEDWKDAVRECDRQRIATLNK